MKKKSKYVFLKNIFDSVTDESETASFNPFDLSEAARKGLIDKHVYAMGGMTLDRIKTVKEMGFGGVVICGDLWNRFDIHNGADFRQVLSYFNQLRQAVR
jgi:thiamine-phosphate pyrophosphorylase